jgi:hypothetical protein
VYHIQEGIGAYRRMSSSLKVCVKKKGGGAVGGVGLGLIRLNDNF